MDIAHFKEKLRALEDIIFFDQHEYLREKATNPLQVVEAIKAGEGLLKGSNEDTHYFLYSTLGNLYRIIEQPKKAIYYLTSCVNQAKTDGNLLREIVSFIRLGEAYKYDSNHIEALDKFNEAMNLCQINNVVDYLDFVLQHKGKCLMELGLLIEAEACFLETLDLRIEKGDSSLIESTHQALQFIKELKQNDADG